MPRKGYVSKREVLADPIYGNKIVTKLINQVMLDGKRGTAQRICYGAFDLIKEKDKGRTHGGIRAGIEQYYARIGGKSQKSRQLHLSGAMEVRPARRQTLGLRWLVSYARARGEKTMLQRLAGG